MSTAHSVAPEPPSPLEIAVGTALEPWNSRVKWRATRRHTPGTARQVLERQLGAAFRRGSVAVSFSGGRDSSLLLAVACAVARREGFDDPVPVTMKHSSPESDETSWQTMVIDHLGLDRWVRFDAGDELDVLGPQALAFLRRSGLLLPPNAYLHLGMLRAAMADTMVTGAGGDELLGSHGSRLAQVRARRTTPELRDLARVAVAFGPRPVRRRRRAPTLPDGWGSWLRPAALREVVSLMAQHESAVRYRWDREAAQWAGSRSVALGSRAIALVGAETGTTLMSPLMSDEFISAFASEVGLAGPLSRAESMRRLGHDLLPAPVLERRTKAVFDGVVWGPEFRRFVETWEPDTLRPEVLELIDVDRLRTVWSGRPQFATMSIAQAAFLDAGARATS